MILQVQNICRSFGEKEVLRGVSFDVAEGEAIALTGSNGAGKTTLLRIITRLLQPDSGEVLFCGHPLRQDDLQHIGYLPEERGLYRRMKVREQALYFARLKGLGRREAEQSVDDWFSRLEMTPWASRQAGQLSKGMQQRLQLVIAVAHRPRLLILDEPFSGFDAFNSDRLQAVINSLRTEGTAILISTHNLQVASSLCSRIVSL